MNIGRKFNHVMKPLVTWVFPCWLAGFILYFIIGLAVLAITQDEEAAKVINLQIAQFAHLGLFIGLLIGGSKALKRLFAGRETLHK